MDLVESFGLLEFYYYIYLENYHVRPISIEEMANGLIVYYMRKMQ